MDLIAQLRALEHGVEERSAARTLQSAVADEELRREERLAAFGVEADPERRSRARACRCNACPDCRPEIDRVATIVDVPFASVLMYADRAMGAALDHLLDLRGPVTNRPDKRRQQRFAQKQEKRKARRVRL